MGTGRPAPGGTMPPNLVSPSPRALWTRRLRRGAFDVLVGPLALLDRLAGLLRRARRPPARILVLKPDHLGDLLLAQPALAALRAAYPEAEIRVLAKAPYLPLLERCPWVDVAEPFDVAWGRHPGESRLGSLEVLGRALGLRVRHRPDLALSLQDDPRNHLFALLAGAPRRIGRAPRGGRALLTDALPAPGPTLHEADAHLELADRAGAPGLDAPPALALGPRDHDAAAACLAAAGVAPGEPYLVLHVGAGHPAKALPEATLGELVGLLSGGAEGPRLVVAAGPAERELAARVAAPGRAPLLPACDLPTLAAVMAGARLVLAHDSGPGHLAAAAGAPVLSLFGPSDPARWSPRACGGGRVRVQRRVVCEAPCGADRPVEPCPCFRDLPAREIAAAAREVLAQGDGSPVRPG